MIRTSGDGVHAFAERGGCGFSFGNGCSPGESEVNMFGAKRTNRRDIIETVQVEEWKP